jgi:hypothetical protein
MFNNPSLSRNPRNTDNTSRALHAAQDGHSNTQALDCQAILS